mgnify:CR=1 FL=1
MSADNMNPTRPLIDSLTQFITSELGVEAGTTLTPETDLLEGSIVDSMGIMRLVAFIEAEFGYVVPPQDVIIEHFATINLIAEYLEPKLSEDAK